MAWTEEMIDSLKQMWKEGLTTTEIAKRLGVSKNSIVGKVHRLNLKARPSPIKKKEEVVVAPEVTVAKEEETVKQVAKPIKKINISPINVSNEKVKKENSYLKLTELDNHTCRWPIGDPRDDNFCFCGKAVRSGQTYCEEHSAIAYVKPLKKDK